MPLELAKEIELELEGSGDDTVKTIEPLLITYRGAATHFKDIEGGLISEFVIGAGNHQNKIIISIIKDSDHTANLRLRISALNNHPSNGEFSKLFKRIDILLQDVLFHLLSGLKPKGKARVLHRGKICPSCRVINDLNDKFCGECGFNFEKGETTSPIPPVGPAEPLPEVGSAKKGSLDRPALPEKPSIPRKPEKPNRPQLTIVENPERSSSPKLNLQSTPDLISQLDQKYKQKYECQLCDFKCAYKNTFILLLSDIENLEQPFKKFDEFLRTKDISSFSNYIYDFAITEMQKYPKFSNHEIPAIAYCIFSMLSWHILEKASEKIRLTFAKKMKERIGLRFKKENPLIASSTLIDTEVDGPIPTIKTGTLHIEENRCPYCYKKFDDRILKLKMKGYIVECPVCGKML
ncbi:MAG: hypothetical protein ACTSQ8_05410 [Candidatus Helarchaeota archaeon]